MDRQMLSDAQWARTSELLPGNLTDTGGRAVDSRWFVEGVLCTARFGNSWRDLPLKFGNWHSVYVAPPGGRSMGFGHALPRRANAIPPAGRATGGTSRLRA